MPAVVNSGPLIALAKLNHLQLLVRLYGSLFVPQGVYDEVVIAGRASGRADAMLVQEFLDRERCAPTLAPDMAPVVLRSQRLGRG